MKFLSLLRPTSLFLILSLGVSACGYSQEEWDQKTRENESLQKQLQAQTDAHKKSQKDYDDAVQEIDGLKKQLADRGANLDNLETHDERLILPKTCFSVEPGLYFPGEFGVRSEVDMIALPGRAFVTGRVQTELVRI